MPTPHEKMVMKLLATASTLNGFGWAALLGSLVPGVRVMMAGDATGLWEAILTAAGGVATLTLFSCLATMATGLALTVETVAPAVNSARAGS